MHIHANPIPRFPSTQFSSGVLVYCNLLMDAVRSPTSHEHGKAHSKALELSCAQMKEMLKQQDK